MSDDLLLKIYNQIINDPLLEVPEGKSRKDHAIKLAKQKFIQHLNNERALEMGNEDIEKQI